MINNDEIFDINERSEEDMDPRLALLGGAFLIGYIIYGIIKFIRDIIKDHKNKPMSNDQYEKYYNNLNNKEKELINSIIEDIKNYLNYIIELQKNISIDLLKWVKKNNNTKDEHISFEINEQYDSFLNRREKNFITELKNENKIASFIKDILIKVVKDNKIEYTDINLGIFSLFDYLFSIDYILNENEYQREYKNNFKTDYLNTGIMLKYKKEILSIIKSKVNNTEFHGKILSFKNIPIVDTQNEDLFYPEYQGDYSYYTVKPIFNIQCKLNNKLTNK